MRDPAPLVQARVWLAAIRDLVVNLLRPQTIGEPLLVCLTLQTMHTTASIPTKYGDSCMSSSCLSHCKPVTPTEGSRSSTTSRSYRYYLLMYEIHIWQFTVTSEEPSLHIPLFDALQWTFGVSANDQPPRRRNFLASNKELLSPEICIPCPF
ncbi:hypothetical protein LIA77_09309 [Sarocladium implicatum]|nr:hypothetical protein LIA77_09309 [Sarocladium implicatum]